MEDNFSTDHGKQGVGYGLRMIPTYYIYCALYFYYNYISSTSEHQALDLGGRGPSSRRLGSHKNENKKSRHSLICYMPAEDLTCIDVVPATQQRPASQQADVLPFSQVRKLRLREGKQRPRASREKTLESPLHRKEIQPVHPKGDPSWVFIGRTDVEAETPILWPPDMKS